MTDLSNAFSSAANSRARSLGNRHAVLIRTKDAPGWLSIGVGYFLFGLALAVCWLVLF